jgi:hypothetical protein
VHEHWRLTAADTYGTQVERQQALHSDRTQPGEGLIDPAELWFADISTYGDRIKGEYKVNHCLVECAATQGRKFQGDSACEGCETLDRRRTPGADRNRLPGHRYRSKSLSNFIDTIKALRKIDWFLRRGYWPVHHGHGLPPLCCYKRPFRRESNSGGWKGGAIATLPPLIP